MNDLSRQAEREGLPRIDFAYLDWQERRIRRDMLLSIAVGLLLGLGGLAVTDLAPVPAIGSGIDAVSVPAFAGPVLFGVVLAVGRLSLGFGWAVLNGALLAAGLLGAHLVVSAARGESLLHVLGGGAAPDRLMFVTVVCTALAYLARHENIWGDAAAGLLAVLLTTDTLGGVVVWRPALVSPAPSWGSEAGLAFGLFCIALLRSRWTGRLRAAGVAGAVAAVYAFVTAA